MRDACNDNDELSFRSIGLAAALILNRLRLATQLEATEEQQKDRNGKTDGSDAEKQREEKQRQYIEHRLAQLRAFERKAGGVK
jgi:hypothetical protein